jgi:hypothetical protein
MEINGLKLPPLFVEAIREGVLRRGIGSWEFHWAIFLYAESVG